MGISLEPIVHGMILAFGLILPLGVQNVFIFNQGATQKRFINALPAVITASICDTLLISLAVAGVSIIVFSLGWLKVLLFVVGFFFLVYMGWVMWKSDTEVEREQRKFTTRRQITFAASVSLLNPHAIMDTIGVIGTSSLVYEGLEKWIFAVACILVSWLWFIGLAIAGKLIGQYGKSSNLLKRLNQFSAFIIWVMAVYMGYQIIWG